MDETCVWLEKMLAWIDRRGAPVIPYAGHPGHGYRNAPAPHIELVVVLDSEVRDLKLGDRVVGIPPHHVALHSIHHGAFTPRIQHVDAWCVFLDVRDEREFEPLESSPLFCASPLRRHGLIVESFERLASRCTRYGSGPLNYLASKPLYDPQRDGGASSAAGILVKAALLELFALLLEELAPGRDEHASRTPAAVQNAMEFMGLHYRTSGLRLEDVARAAGLSEDHFGRAFREATGETPMRYLRRIRADQSRYLLEHTTMRVEEVAREVGFTD
jgi:AraC-like DNA-binding protein